MNLRPWLRAWDNADPEVDPTWDNPEPEATGDADNVDADNGGSGCLATAGGTDDSVLEFVAADSALMMRAMPTRCRVSDLPTLLYGVVRTGADGCEERTRSLASSSSSWVIRCCAVVRSSRDLRRSRDSTVISRCSLSSLRNNALVRSNCALTYEGSLIIDASSV